MNWETTSLVQSLVEQTSNTWYTNTNIPFLWRVATSQLNQDFEIELELCSFDSW
jgi:hypothetical protein